jgi:2-polyprenyl-6-methoxyphenol hydroxylase-like FAD-dependent oxidoreductase
VETTPGNHPGWTAHHPELQETLLSAAAQVGCEVARGVRVTEVQPGVEVLVGHSGDPRRSEHARARLFVLADGRSSRLREQLGLITRGERSPLCVSGVLLDAARSDDAIEEFYPSALGSLALLVPLSAERTRAYLVQHTATALERYSGPAHVQALLSHCAKLGVPEDFTRTARALGPLGTFETTLSELDPQSLPRGVVAVGDAAGTVDPTFGCGLSMALRDARILGEHLGAQSDLPLAAARFARERASYHSGQLRIEGWLRRILFRCGTDSPALLSVAVTRLQALRLDLIGRGPDGPSDAQTEAQLFADP